LEKIQNKKINRKTNAGHSRKLSSRNDHNSWIMVDGVEVHHLSHSELQPPRPQLQGSHVAHLLYTKVLLRTCLLLLDQRRESMSTDNSGCGSTACQYSCCSFIHYQWIRHCIKLKILLENGQNPIRPPGT